MRQLQINENNGYLPYNGFQPTLQSALKLFDNRTMLSLKQTEPSELDQASLSK